MWLLRSPETLTLIAEHRQEIAGFIALQFHPPAPLGHCEPPDACSHGELITIDVLPKFQRVRIGWQLHQAVEQMFVQRGGSCIELHVAIDNIAGIAFYQRLNYQVIGRVPRYYLDSIPAWRMKKICTQSETVEPQT